MTLLTVLIGGGLLIGALLSASGLPASIYVPLGLLLGGAWGYGVMRFYYGGDR